MHSGMAGMMPGHHGQQGTEQGYGAGGVGGTGQQGYGQEHQVCAKTLSNAESPEGVLVY
jgi:hypothetical protein